MVCPSGSEWVSCDLRVSSESHRVPKGLFDPSPYLFHNESYVGRIRTQVDLLRNR